MEIKSVVVLGSGTMGRGIAQWFCQQGVRAELVDLEIARAVDAQKQVLLSWEKLKTKGKFTEREVESFTQNLIAVESKDVSKDADLFIEAIIEDLDVKHRAFTEWDKHFEAKTVFASNTSSLPIASLSTCLSGKRKEEFLGLHFFNPAPIMKLVEIIPSSEISQNLAREFYQWFEERGKKPALSEDMPGFIVNRVARNFYGEAFRIVELDEESRYNEHDRIMKEVAGFRMGPFELMDLIGIDVNYDVTCSVWDSFYREPRFSPHRLQKKMVDSGRLGRKVKKGFYSYDK